MDIDTREIEIRDLRPNNGEVEGLPRNPRKISKKNLEKLKKSVQDAPEMLRLRELIVVPHGDGYVVIAGNQRLAAAKAVGMETLPCKVLPADTDPAKLREYAIKDNLPFGEDDWEVIASDWDTAELEDWGMSVPKKWKNDPTAEEDDFDPDSVKETVCKKGDIWQLGDHRLMCGDSTDAGDVALLMDEEKADMVFADPPYGVSYSKKNEFLNALGTGHRLTKRIENDDRSPEEMYDFWVKAFTNLHQFSKDKMAYYITAPQGGDLLLLLLLQAIRESGFMLKHQLVWNKNNHVLGRCDYNYKHEPMIYGWKIGGTHKFYGCGDFKTSVWDIAKPLQSKLHPTMKPVALVANCMKDTTKEGDSVLDLFGGSGTTLIAAEQLGRKCFMMELDPHYCYVIIARWEKLTGNKAIKIN